MGRRSARRRRAARLRGDRRGEPVSRTPARPVILARTEPTEAELRGEEILAAYTLIECPRWTAERRGATKRLRGQIELAKVSPQFPFTRDAPICPRCGIVVDEQLGCPKMKSAERAIRELLRMQDPEVLHSEA